MVYGYTVTDKTNLSKWWKNLRASRLIGSL